MGYGQQKSMGYGLRLKEKEKHKKGEENKTVVTQEVTNKEVVSIDDKNCEEVFEEDLVTDEPDPRTRLRVRSRRLVTSVGAGESIAKPRHPIQIKPLNRWMV